MTAEEIRAIVDRQRTYFRTGATLDVDFRLRALDRLAACIRANETVIGEAIRQDLGKSAFESYMCETGMVLSELRYMRTHLRRFARDRSVRTPLAQFHARSYVKPSPYGVVLVMSPWNYPFMLSLEPLVDAIASGNTVVVKPSAYAPRTGELIARMLRVCFPEEYVAVVTGGRAENTALLEQHFDYIFFTGSQAVGREVLRHTAERLTPAVLELGGKSPCIVDETARLPLAARRIVFGKYLNCGQTCVAPDYILCHSSVKDRLVDALRREIRRQYGAEPLDNPSYGRIVNEKHFQRLLGLIDPDKVAAGGQSRPETLQIAPTILERVAGDDPVMQEEIFGPILPVLTYDRFEDLYAALADRAKPLALYLFSQDRARVREAMSRFRFGGGCVNDVVIHLASSELGFGGVGESGMGAYHGRAGFEAFSHTKSIVDKKTWVDLPMRYQPYQEGRYGKLVRLFLR